jgi:hypothetical protein
MTQDQCQAAPGCAVALCANCVGVQSFFACYEQNQSPPACGPPMCPACDTYQDDMTCEGSGYCHSVFVSEAPPACVRDCTRFARCADGPKAMCAGMPGCAQPSPYCEPGVVVVSYTQTCYEGCVRPAECGM